MWQSFNIGSAAVEPAVVQFLPPCQMQCPINEDIQRTNILISLLPDDPDSAREGIIQIGDYLFEANPLFTVCGYVCGLCELACNYRSKGGAIKRRLLKRFIGDTYTEYLREKEEFYVRKSKENIAVVGGGPAGLFCAFDLSKRGYRVTLFEASDKLGGALWLIPRYRLPEDELRSAIENLVRIAGVDVKYGFKISEGKLTLDWLTNQGYEAIFMAKGTPTPRSLVFNGQEVRGQNLSGVVYGHTFLYEVSHGNIQSHYFQGKRVFVIGGGNVAFDVARTARRLGGETTVICLECEDKSSPDGIPADWDEIKGAWQERVRIIYSRGVSEIHGEGERVKSIECPRCTGVFDETGFNPKFDTSDILRMEADVLIITVGQGPDKASLSKDDLLDKRGRLAVDPLTLQSTNRENVFVGGDLRRPGFMVNAMKDGLVAAESIVRYLAGKDMKKGRKLSYEAQDIPIRRLYRGEPEVLWIPPEKRMHFQLYERGFTPEEAIEEANRCLCCGPCISCKACVSIGILDFLPTVEVNNDRCSGCGICVSACFYHASHLKEVEGHMISTTDPFKCKSCGMCVDACPSGTRRMIGDTVEEMLKDAYSVL